MAPSGDLKVEETNRVKSTGQPGANHGQPANQGLDAARRRFRRSGGVRGISVESAPGKSLEELSGNIAHGQVGCCTVGSVHLAAMTLGNGLAETRDYNSRLQPWHIQVGSLLTLAFDYGTTDNNGNMHEQIIQRPSVTSWISYAPYDGMNRLTTAVQTGTNPWSHSYGYDAYGNRWQTSPTATTLETPVANVYNSLNRINGFTYDAAGNILIVPSATTPIRTSTYDAENRQVTATNVNSVTGTYAYDGEGHRVKSTVGAVTTVFVYDAMGHLAAEYGGPTPTEQGTRYFSEDHLGSTRLVTKEDGTEDKRYDYFPFGQEVGVGVPLAYPQVAGSNSVKFTSKERDPETGLDYFGARYMSSAQGRFTSPDKPFADQHPNDPQSWNLYSYVRNNPLKNRDPNGQVCIWGIGNTCSETPAATAAQGSAAGTGAQLLNDGVRRGQYQQAASQLSGPGGSAARKALQADTYGKLSPIGKGLTDAAKAARAGQLAGKTAEQLAQSASTTSGTWNAIGSASKTVGAIGVVVGVGMAASNITSAPEGQRGQVVAGEAGSLGGGLAGGYGGAWLGGAIGTFFAPGPGTAIGAFIGGLGGGAGGAVLGEKAATEVYKKVEDQ